MEDTFYYYFLTCLWSLTPIRLHEIVDYYGGPKEFYEASEKDYEGIHKKTIQTILRTKSEDSLLRNWENLRRDTVRFIPCNSPDYPKEFLQLPDYPFGIYIEGKLPHELDPEGGRSPRIAVVGARNGTTYGRETAFRYAKELAMSGCRIISGLASGIDGAAHAGCLDGQGYTIGILGSGIHKIYPKENYKLYLSMRERGGILSEYPPDLEPYAHLFPRRNRLISILADYVLVVEAKKKSGSLITVDYALEQGKTVGAVPGRPCDVLSEGCNHLIRQGAACVTDACDVLEELADNPGFLTVRKDQVTVNLSLGLAQDEKKVYSVLRLEPQFVDDIITAIDFPVWKTVSILSELEIKGVVRQDPHQFYYRIQ